MFGKSIWFTGIGKSAKLLILVSWITDIRFSSLPVKGPRLFNVLPKHLRDMSKCSTERFKGELDCYLETIPDEPLIPGLTQYRRCDSNSVIDWAVSIPASAEQPAPGNQLPRAGWGGHNVMTCWIPQTLQSDTEWVIDICKSFWLTYIDKSACFSINRISENQITNIY